MMSRLVFAIVGMIAISLSLSSCTTAKKCNQKFPTIQRDTIVVIEIDTFIQIENIKIPLSINEFSPSESLMDSLQKMQGKTSTVPGGGDYNITLIPSDHWIDLNTSIDDNKVNAILQQKGDSIRAKCQADSLLVIVKNLKVHLKLEKEAKLQIEQKFFDAKGELKLEKEERKKLAVIYESAVQEAKADKWNNIWKLGLMLVILAVIGFAFYITKKII